MDIWDKLLEGIPSDGVAHSYGEVEDRFIERYPAEASLLHDRYGHRWREGKRSANQYTMSVYLAARLRDLAREGAVEAELVAGRRALGLQRNHQPLGEALSMARVEPRGIPILPVDAAGGPPRETFDNELELTPILLHPSYRQA